MRNLLDSHFYSFKMSSMPGMGCSNSREWESPPPYEPYPPATNAPPYAPFSSVNTVGYPPTGRNHYGGHHVDMSPMKFGFGIEIEAIVQPWKRRPDWSPAQYYERLAQALRNRDLSAKGDPCIESYRKHPEHYGKWFITRDGSLATRPGCSMNTPSNSIRSLLTFSSCNGGSISKDENRRELGRAYQTLLGSDDDSFQSPKRHLLRQPCSCRTNWSKMDAG